MKKSDKFQTFDNFMLEYLKDPEESTAYLDAAIEEYEIDGDTRALMIAIQRVAEVKGGITELARKTNLNRQNLYRIFSNQVSPRFDTLSRILRALGYTVSFKKLANVS
ncbi:MAG: addiction module antidote protein [bacterium]